MDAIELHANWPQYATSPNEMSVSGYAQVAAAYFEAAEVLLGAEDWRSTFLHSAGPVMQLTGLAAELTLKALLRGAGKDQRQLKSYSHNTYKAYFDAREIFSEVKFLGIVFANTEHLMMPDEVEEMLALTGEDDPHIKWRVFFDHLRILDEVYDRPYRSRYFSPGAIHLPEPVIILIGVKILLNAMFERLGLDLLPDSHP